jgi:hypothetical protein
MFRLVDEDQSGVISMDELRAHMEARGYEDDEIKIAMGVLDADNNGVISAEEFAALQALNEDTTLEDLLMHNKAPDAVLDRLRTGKGCELPDASTRAITLRQLKQVYLEQVVDRCRSEGWIGRRRDARGEWTYVKLTAESVNLYDAQVYIIEPATAPRGCSCVELLAEDAQNPDWVVSSPWGLPLHSLIQCLECHARDVGLGDEACYWIAAFSNNQHELSEAACGIPTTDPSDTLVGKAMARSQGMLSIVDEAGMCFERLWCDYEAFLAVDVPPPTANWPASFRYGVYTALAHQYTPPEGSGYPELRMAVGLLDGLACDPGSPTLAEESLSAKLRRERAFPMYLLDKGVAGAARRVELAQVMRPEDRARILNTLVGSEPLDSPPPEAHDRLTFVNEALQGALAAFGLNEVLPDLTKPDGVHTARAEWFLRAIRSGHVRRLDTSLELMCKDDALQQAALEAIFDAADPERLESLRIAECTVVTQRPPPEDPDDDDDLDEDRPKIDVPNKLSELTSLVSLSLCGACKMEALPPISMLWRLQELDLRRCARLKVVSDDVCELKLLTTLRLADCTSLTRLPEELGGPPPEEEEEDVGGVAAASADDTPVDEAAPPAYGKPPPTKLTLLELSGCTALSGLPDLSRLGGLKVVHEGCKAEMFDFWEKGGRKKMSISAVL